MEAQQDEKISISRRVTNAIRKLQNNKGVSLVDLKKYLRDQKNLDVVKYNEEIKLALKNGLDRDIFTRESGMYKMDLFEKNKIRRMGFNISPTTLKVKEVSRRVRFKETSPLDKGGKSREKSVKKRSSSKSSRKKTTAK